MTSVECDLARVQSGSHEILLFYQEPHSSHSLLRVPQQCWGPCLVPQTGHLDNDKPSPTKICTTRSFMVSGNLLVLKEAVLC